MLSKELGEVVEYRGIEGLVAAEVIKDNNLSGEGEGYVTGEIFSIAGIAELSKTTESADEVTCSVSAIDQEVLAKITGQHYDAETGTLIEGERKNKYFAIGYKTKKTNGDEVYVWRYKGTFNIPEATHATENDGTDANGQEITYTGIKTTHKFAKIGAGAKAINVDLGKDLADVTGFFDKVTTPDDLKKKTETPAG